MKHLRRPAFSAQRVSRDHDRMSDANTNFDRAVNECMKTFAETREEAERRVREWDKQANADYDASI
jgi:hypothetical protein